MFTSLSFFALFSSDFFRYSDNIDTVQSLEVAYRFFLFEKKKRKTWATN